MQARSQVHHTFRRRATQQKTVEGGRATSEAHADQTPDGGGKGKRERGGGGLRGGREMEGRNLLGRAYAFQNR